MWLKVPSSNPFSFTPRFDLHHDLLNGTTFSKLIYLAVYHLPLSVTCSDNHVTSLHYTRPLLALVRKSLSPAPQPRVRCQPKTHRRNRHRRQHEAQDTPGLPAAFCGNQEEVPRQDSQAGDGIADELGASAGAALFGGRRQEEGGGGAWGAPRGRRGRPIIGLERVAVVSPERHRRRLFAGRQSGDEGGERCRCCLLRPNEDKKKKAAVISAGAAKKGQRGKGAQPGSQAARGGAGWRGGRAHEAEG